MKVTALAGGVGGAKLLVGLDRTDVELTAVVNTGDDAEIFGVHVSPDVDICTYWLAGIADTERGWGILDDTFHLVGALATLGEDAWFNLGDRDFATCIMRTKALATGTTLTEITDRIRRALGIRALILPMSDDPVRTRIDTADGRTLDFQEYFVKERQTPEVTSIRFAGVADAKPAPGVVEALRDADVVIVCPSNPIVSIGPILALPQVRETLSEHPRVLAVTPIIRGAPLKGPADKLMAATGARVSASGVAELYRDFLDAFVVDASDEAEADTVAELDVEPLILDTIMHDHAASERLARALL